MRKIHCILGKSSSGKDTIYKKLYQDDSLKLQKNVMYTTRPMRDGEKEGVDYHYVNQEFFEVASKEQRVVESRTYNTVYGPWTYFTLADSIDLKHANHLFVNTLVGFKAIRDYYGKENVLPYYIWVEDIVRIERALNREKKEVDPKVIELCRRFLADHEDFCIENLKEAGIDEEHSYKNDNLEECYGKIKEKILNYV